MSRWQLIGRYWGECIARRPRLMQALARVIGPIERLFEIGAAAWKLAVQMFWVAFYAALGCAAIYVLWLAAGYILVYLAPSSPYGYAIKYNVADSSVTIERRPHDCEWESAPLGSKHCHYEAKVTSVSTKAAADGTRLVSYDEGKTWVINAYNDTDRVYVSWSKIDD